MIASFHGEYRWLSNFAPVKIVWLGHTWPTIEHAYQASKAGDIPSLEMVLAAETPGRAKRASRKKGFVVRRDWDEVKLGIMDQLSRQKYSQEPYRTLLLETGDEEIIEGNSWHDRFWGVCMCEKCDATGQNNLGRLLMQIRDEL